MPLFADDCLMYRPINNTSDCEKFQQDLNHLHQWSETWQMKFNTDKCHVMRFTLRQKANIILTEYNLGGSRLTTVAEYPYLGLTLQSKLSWNSHITKVTKKSQQNVRTHPTQP